MYTVLLSSVALVFVAASCLSQEHISVSRAENGKPFVVKIVTRKSGLIIRCSPPIEFMVMMITCHLTTEQNAQGNHRHTGSQLQIHSRLRSAELTSFVNERNGEVTDW